MSFEGAKSCGTTVVAMVAVQAALCTPASGGESIAVAGEDVALAANPLCRDRSSSVVLLGRSGVAQRVGLGRRAREARVAGDPSGFAASWLIQKGPREERAASAALIAPGGLGAPFGHGPVDETYLGDSDVAIRPGGERIVVWEAPDGVRLQRIRSDGTALPAVLVYARGEADGFLGPQVVAVNPNGSVWVLVYGDLNVRPRVIRVTGDDEAGAPIPIPSVTGEVFVHDETPDGRGGLYVLLTGYASFDDTNPGFTDNSSRQDLVHVTAGGDVRRRAVAEDYDGALDAKLAATRTRPTVLFHRYGSGQAGLYLRRILPGDRLSKPRRLRGNGRVEDAVADPTGRSVLALLAPTRSRIRRLVVQRVPLRGEIPASTTVAAIRRRARAPVFADGSLAITRHGRLIVRWSVAPLEQDFAPTAEFVRIRSKAKLGKPQVLWRCAER